MQVVLAMYSSWHSFESWSQFAPKYKAIAQRNPNIVFCKVDVDEGYVGQVS